MNGMPVLNRIYQPSSTSTACSKIAETTKKATKKLPKQTMNPVANALKAKAEALDGLLKLWA